MRTVWLALISAIAGLGVGLFGARLGSDPDLETDGVDRLGSFVSNHETPEGTRAEPLQEAFKTALDERGNDAAIPDQLLLWQLLEAEPAAALRLLEEQPLSPLLRGIVREWSERAPETAVNALRSVTDPELAVVIGGGVLAGSDFDTDVWQQVLAWLPPSVSAKTFIAENVAAWTTSDPNAALSFSLALPEPSRRAAAVLAAARSWPEDNIEEALAAWDDDADPALVLFAGSLLDHYSDLNPERSLRFMTQRKKLIDISHFNHAATQLARDDPQLVLAIANEATPRRKQILMRAALAEWAMQDPDGAIAYALEQPSGRGKMQLLQSAGMAFGRNDPARALAWAENLQPPAPELLTGVLMGYANREPLAALEHVIGMESNAAQAGALSAVAFRASQEDPEGALSLLLTASASPVLDQATSNVLQGWARSDAGAMREWLRSNATRVPASAFTQISQQLAFSDPVGAAELLGVVPEAAQAQWLGSIARGYARQDPQAALDWLASQSGRPGYVQANRQLLNGLAESDPRKAAQLVSNIDDRRQRARAVQGVAAVWGQRDPIAALDWLAQVPASDGREGGVNSIVSIWSQQAPAQALTWARNQADPTTRETAIMSYLRSRQFASESDIGLLDEITNPQRKQQALAGLAMNGARRNPALAQKILAQIEDENLRNRLAQQIGVPPAGGARIPR